MRKVIVMLAAMFCVVGPVAAQQPEPCMPIVDEVWTLHAIAYDSDGVEVERDTVEYDSRSFCIAGIGFFAGGIMEDQSVRVIEELTEEETLIWAVLGWQDQSQLLLMCSLPQE